ncbi:zinc finger protein 583-like [Procambarus clarkii]|uniref:zinc finger protein 583-like n=1 Tax=Procambarus clarkii TaxID=6728 RepID=UPI0037421E7C
MVVYTSKKPFECPECRKRFSNHKKMDKHMMVCTVQHQLRRLRTPQTRKPTKKVGFLSSSTAAQQIRHLLAVYLDFSKVFDRVPHGRLVKKIEGHGIGGCYVKLDGCTKGNRKLVQMGLSQGGEIVPLIGKSFSKHRNMNNYTMVVYTSKKHFECPECRKRFSNHRKMDKHMMVCTVQHQLRRLRTPQTRKPTKKVEFLSSSTAAQQIRHLLGTRPPHGGHHTKLQRQHGYRKT